jgi:hypothetical protein
MSEKEHFADQYRKVYGGNTPTNSSYNIKQILLAIFSSRFSSHNLNPGNIGTSQLENLQNMNCDLPKIDTMWRHNTKQTIYRVWAIALATPRDPFVIYQIASIPKTVSQVYAIRHSEIGICGTVCMRSRLNSLDCGIEWNISSVHLYNNNKLKEAIAWASPLKLWREKFQLSGESDN